MLKIGDKLCKKGSVGNWLLDKNEYIIINVNSPTFIVINELGTETSIRIFGHRKYFYTTKELRMMKLHNIKVNNIL